MSEGPVVLMSDGALKRQGDSLVPTGVVCSVWRDTNQTVSPTTWTAILFNQKNDPTSMYDPATGKFTPRIPGYYRISACMLTSSSANGQGLVSLLKNTTPPAGAAYRRLAQSKTPIASDVSAGGSTIVYCNGTTDFFILAGYTSDTLFEGNSNGEYTFADIDLVGSSVGVIPEPWHNVGATGEPAFQSGWVNFGGGLSTVAFFKDPYGIVHLKGQVANGTAGASIFTLPAGYRPSERLDPAIATSAGVASVAIGSNGSILPTAAAGNTRVSLDGITFRAEL